MDNNTITHATFKQLVNDGVMRSVSAVAQGGQWELSVEYGRVKKSSGQLMARTGAPGLSSTPYRSIWLIWVFGSLMWTLQVLFLDEGE